MSTALPGILAGVLCTASLAPLGIGLPAAAPPGLAGAPLMPVAVEHHQTGSPTRPAKGRFLIASRSLGDPNFSESVLLILAYSAQGAVAVAINRPTDVRLATALPDVKELHERADRVFLGGPVAGNLMVLLIRSRAQPKSSQAIFADVYASGSLDTLREALGKKGKSGSLRAYAGYAGWGAGQLDGEIDRGDWYVTAADAGTIFETPSAEIWPKLIERFSGEWTRRWNERPARAQRLAAGP